MNKITQSEIESLANTEGNVALSMYMPTHKISTPATIKEDQARYKNILNEGLEKWGASADPEIIKETRKELEAYIDNTAFWADTQKSIGIFTNGAVTKVYHLPIECDEYVHVGDFFDLAPLRLSLSQDQPYYILALAKHEPKVFYADSYGAEPIDLELPKSPEDALQIDEMFSGSNTIRAMSTSKGGNETFSTHGQGDSNHAGQEEHLKYLRIIDDKILKSSHIDQSLPLIIAATDNEASEFKHISNNQKLVERHLQGNHTTTAAHELHALTWEIVCDELVKPKLHDLLERFNETKGQQKASSDVAEITEAITNGRVDTLLLGVIEKTNDTVSDKNEAPAPLLRLQNGYQTNGMRALAQAVIAQGGRVIGVEADSLGTPSSVAALYRY